VRQFLLAGLLTGLVAGAIPAPGRATEFVPHQALYALTMMSARQGSGIATVSGEMHADWTEDCDGWVFNHQFALDVAYTTGSAGRITSNVTTWESRNGTEYHFNVRNLTDDQVIEAIEGMARLADGKKGIAVFEQPEAKRIDLPRGTMFPIAHTELLLKLTEKAPTIIARPVFDGLSEDGAFEINAVIGPAIAPSKATTGAQATLADRRSWSVQMAFFPIGSSDAQPYHEIGLRLYDNGVADDFVIRFAEFSVRARLREIEYYKRPVCTAQ